MSTWEQLAQLPIDVEGYDLLPLAENVSSGFLRQTTVVRLKGGGHEGLGEDVVYDGVDQDAFQAAGPVHELTSARTLGDFTQLISELDLFPTKSPEREVSRLYRRWSFDSAALDLALRQAGMGLEEAVGRPSQSLAFVVSLRLGEPPTLEPIMERLAIDPTVQFKLDPTDDWDPELIAQLAATGAVESVDFKALYSGSPVDQTGGVELYQRVIGALPEAWIEDPGLEVQGVNDFLTQHRDRITWDANIHSIADIEALPFKPKMVNVKPSRVGGLQSLMETYDYCDREGIRMYGGGQFELGVGREQAQLLASIFHADGPNDLAPTGWNAVQPTGPLLSSPLQLSPAATGLRLA
ncbi:MAG: hypothetical protein NTY57_07295 [Solirubrobacterales bacterium]|nr:hypothetical protein [Solirubrobacterales bacterium]